MDFLTFLLWLASACTCIYLLKLRLTGRKPGLPPGPRPLPIIGNILNLGDKVHLSLSNLSKTYGPVMSLKIGSITSIVISSSETAKEVLQRNDQAFSGRTVPAAIKVRNYPESSMVWAPASSHWRKIRKICIMQMLSMQQVDASREIRRKVVQQLLDHVKECCSSGCAVDIGAAAFTAGLNLLSNIIFSCDLAYHDSNFSKEFKDTVWGVLEGLGRVNIADYFPAFGLIDPQSRRRKMKIHFDKLLGTFDGIIDQRLKSEANSPASKDVLDALLSLPKENDHEWSRSNIKHLLMDLFIAGTDTTAGTIEWAMAELLRNPEKMAKAKNEIREVLGNDGNAIQESDISKLPYFQSIVKETFRMHPPAPLLIPHKAETDVEICGFIIPKNSQVIVNAWAIGRDPINWPNPNEFVPERFMESDIDVKGRDFELIPFGTGRRMCPGMPLAHRMVHLTVASLIHSHSWKLEDGVGPENMDMSEKFGLTMQKAQPLRAIPVKV